MSRPYNPPYMPDTLCAVIYIPKDCCRAEIPSLRYIKGETTLRRARSLIESNIYIKMCKHSTTTVPLESFRGPLRLGTGGFVGFIISSRILRALVQAFFVDE